MEELHNMYDLITVADIVGREGLGYSIQNYLDSSSIEDQYLSVRWQQAKKLLNEIETYIETEMRKKDPDWEWSW